MWRGIAFWPVRMPLCLFAPLIHSTRKAIVGEVIGLQFEPEDIHIMRLNETEEEFDARIEEYVEIEEQEAGLINAIEEERDEENNL